MTVQSKHQWRCNMTLREFIEQEINLGTISCFEDFRSSSILYFDIEEIDLDEYEDYLDHDVEWAEIHIKYNRYGKTVWYAVEVVK